MPNFQNGNISGKPGHRQDHGPEPFITNIAWDAKQNRRFRTALWTGRHLQMTLMSIPVGSDIGFEMHRDTDQFIRVEQGQGAIVIEPWKSHANLRRSIVKDSGIFIPAGTWHNIINTGKTPLKLSSVYAPPHHPWGTVHMTKADAEE